jgi:DNA-binding transcriptional LysR family regulator
MMNHAAQLGGRLDVRIQVRSFNAVCRMVAAGVGIGMVPRSAVGTADAVRLIEITDPGRRVICSFAFVRAQPCQRRAGPAGRIWLVWEAVRRDERALPLLAPGQVKAPSVRVVADGRS